MNNKQKKIVLITSLVSVIAGFGVYAYFKIKQKGIKIRIPIIYKHKKGE